ncbi:hypothetical protein PYW08_011940 [Mythimna loreyi]|uniref:Uncharacterized protein n=1 Tax=Mythimna loreyi TaxID=667449 RepID=A0ACC2QNE5_9NEOP|nr:hypothetical protein PYW08_011940 [Mythimna loreyi]
MLHSPTNKSDTELHKHRASRTNDDSVSGRKRKQPEPEWSNAIQALSAEFKNTLNEWRSDLESSINKISDNVTSIKVEMTTITKVTTEIKNDIQSLRSEQNVLRQTVSELETKYNDAMQEIDRLKDSFRFVGDEQSDILRKVSEFSKQNQDYTESKQTISELIAKIDSLEQSARSCNIEICNIPERRNEDLIALITSIGSSINYNLKQSDIISIHRVPHAHRDNDRPKNIIVKLNSRILRDNNLSAYRINKGLNTGKLGLSGKSLPIYMHEHLTLKNKILFRQCRDAAKANNYRFLWVKHGTILVREREGTKSFAIRSPEDIAKIKPSQSVSVPGIAK